MAELYLQGTKWLPFAASVLAGIIFLLIIKKTLDFKDRKTAYDYSFFNQVVMMFLVGLVGLTLIFLLPISDQSRGQLLNFIGILFTAAIALSSTTILGNALAGFMLRFIGQFKHGDFIQVGDHFGRVTVKGILHVEIQTEDRDLKSFSNLYLLRNPLKIIYQTGTIISAQVSLGYDVPHKSVAVCLEKAAAEAGLTDPFVQVMELGDFSITYRAAGFLKEIKYLISARSKLRMKMLEVLHRDGIEITSPTFMNQRIYSPETKFVPIFQESHKDSSLKEHGLPEELVFDKADKAASIEDLKKRLQEVIDDIEQSDKSDKEAFEKKKQLKRYLENLIKSRS